MIVYVCVLLCIGSNARVCPLVFVGGCVGGLGPWDHGIAHACMDICFIYIYICNIYIY